MKVHFLCNDLISTIVDNNCMFVLVDNGSKTNMIITSVLKKTVEQNHVMIHCGFMQKTVEKR